MNELDTVTQGAPELPAPTHLPQHIFVPCKSSPKAGPQSLAMLTTILAAGITAQRKSKAKGLKKIMFQISEHFCLSQANICSKTQAVSMRSEVGKPFL